MLDHVRYAPGAEAVITIRNRSSHVVQDNLCFHDLDRRMGMSWPTVVAYPPAGEACTDEIEGLVAGGSTTATVAIPADLPAGTYRIHFPELDGGASTPPFEVGP
jgi:hypothetical protein